MSRLLDARTLRAVARRLRIRANELDRKEKRNRATIGESPNNFRVGRACECDLQADEAGGRALEFTAIATSWASHIAAIDHRSVLVTEYLERELRHLLMTLSPSDRDQALSTTTAESGEDESICGKRTIPLSAATHQCYLPENHDGECVWTDMRRDAEPAPVAEAPERVTIEQARHALHRTWTAGDDCKRVLRRYLDQQEQSEREVAELRERVDEEEGRAAVWMEIADQRTRQLTAAERKTEGLRVDNEELKAKLETTEGLLGFESRNANRHYTTCKELTSKLAESERKREQLLVVWNWAWESEARGYWCRDKLSKALAAIGHDPRHPVPASTEPAGVGAGKADPHGPSEWLTPEERAESDPTPTETEAPARFRVCGRIWHAAPGDRWSCVGPAGHTGPCTDPADPAPPKPGGETRDNIELFLSGAEKDWLEGKQTDALWSVICAMREIYPKLEREGGGKS